MSRPPRGYSGGPRGYPPRPPPPGHYGGGYGPPPPPGPGYADPYYSPGPYGGPPPPRYPPNDPGYYDYSSSDDGSRMNPRGAPRPGPPPPPGPLPAAAPGYGSDVDPPSSDAEFRSHTDNTAYANDCEIVVLNKAQQQYGEMVERQMREMGLKVDIMFPKEDIKLTEFLKPVARLGTIFAVIIDAENEKNQCLHFYQFRGVPKPTLCKNVPLHLGKDMILKKYNELKMKEIGMVPDNIKAHIKKLLDDQLLRDPDYTVLIRFLQERKSRQNAFFNRTNNNVEEPKTDVRSLLESQEGQDLQKRIFAILDDMTDDDCNLKK